MKIFKSNNSDTTFIKQLLNVINLNIMRIIVRKYSGDYRIFDDIFYYLLRKFKKKLGVKQLNSQFKQIKTFD